jgi:histidyl-tRNA synthetase
MATKLQAVRGMHDLLPEETALWRQVESELVKVLETYDFKEIRLPIVEKTELYQRSIGEVTDIVEKEMYTFVDKNGESLTLRPEGTAGCVRALIEHGLLRGQLHKLWYQGPMFRHERPQKGRYRQFHQLGVEIFGAEGPDADVELILLARRWFRALGLDAKLELQLNCLGSLTERLAFREELIAYFSRFRDVLDEDSLRRLKTNPLRILDSKNPNLQELIAGAPKLLDYLGEESLRFFESITEKLSACGVKYTLNPRLVRGLDYYCLTVFEWVTTELGAQGTVCAGGRYDTLVEQLGGPKTPAVGFALGMERLIALLQEETRPFSYPQPPHVYLIRVGERAENFGIWLAEKLRDRLPNLRLALHLGGGSFKSQFKKADKSGAWYALIVGEEEAEKSMVSLKSLRSEEVQKTMDLELLVAFLNQRFFS